MMLTRRAVLAGLGATMIARPTRAQGQLDYCFRIASEAAFATDLIAGSPAAGAIPTGLTTVRFGNRDNGLRTLNGWLQRVAIWPVQLPGGVLTSKTQ